MNTSKQILVDKIMETHQKSGSALLKLMTNNRALPTPDTEDYQLKIVFRLCFDAGKDGGKEIMEFSDGLGVNRAAFKRLKLRGGDFLQFVISTRASTQFELFFVDIERIISIQQNVWGLVGPMFESMWLNLLFICSNLPLPPNGKELFKTVRARDDTTYTSGTLLNIVCSVADAMFSEHLSNCIHLVGSRDRAFTEALNDYVTHLIPAILEAIPASKKKNPSMWTEKDENVLKDVEAKLRILLVDHKAFETPATPILDSLVPLMSPMCASAMLDDWHTVNKGVYMVSHCLSHCMKTRRQPS